MTGSGEWQAKWDRLIAPDGKEYRFRIHMDELLLFLNAQQQELAEAQRERDERYELGYKEGESSAMADLFLAFDEIAGIEINGPRNAASQFQAMRQRAEAAEEREQALREALEPWREALQRIADHCDSKHPDWTKDHYGIAAIAAEALAITPEEVKE